MRAQSVLKSFVAAFAGAGLVSFFLMMGIIPALALMQRLSGNVAQHSEVVNPAGFMRSVAIPAAIAAFVIVFVLALYRFSRREHAAPAHH